MRVALVVWGVLIVGAAGVFVALASRGSEDAFRNAQSRSLTLAPAGVLSAARVAAELAREPEPVAAARRTPAVSARCEPKGGGTLRDPWACTVRYRSGTQAHYLVQVQPDGSYSGVGDRVHKRMLHQGPDGRLSGGCAPPDTPKGRPLCGAGRFLPLVPIGAGRSLERAVGRSRPSVGRGTARRCSSLTCHAPLPRLAVPLGPGHPTLSAVWAVLVHGLIGVLVVAPIVWRSQRRALGAALAFGGGVALDLDHVVAAGSLEPSRLEHLAGGRPVTHGLLFAVGRCASGDCPHPARPDRLGSIRGDHVPPAVRCRRRERALALPPLQRRSHPMARVPRGDHPADARQRAGVAEVRHPPAPALVPECWSVAGGVRRRASPAVLCDSPEERGTNVQGAWPGSRARVGAPRGGR